MTWSVPKLVPQLRDPVHRIQRPVVWSSGQHLEAWWGGVRHSQFSQEMGNEEWGHGAIPTQILNRGRLWKFHKHPSGKMDLASSLQLPIHRSWSNSYATTFKRHVFLLFIVVFFSYCCLTTSQFPDYTPSTFYSIMSNEMSTPMWWNVRFFFHIGPNQVVGLFYNCQTLNNFLSF